MRKTGGVVPCENCKKPIYRAGWLMRKITNHFCSRKCAGAWSSVSGAKRGKSNGHWKGGISKHGLGYLMRTDLPRFKLLHREVMEKHLGRPLLSSEIVHHKNGDKKDNRIENLEVMSRSEHIEHHRKELLAAKMEARNA